MAWTPAVVELVNWDTQTIKLYLEDGKILTLAIPTGQSADWRNGDHVEVWLQKTQESAPQVTMRNAAGQTVLRIPVIVEVQEHAAKTVTVRDMDGQPVSVTMQAEKPANWQGGEYAEVWIRKASETR
jgi:hypothetical protein